MSYTELKVKEIKKSRKIYKCEWCNASIELGEVHNYRSYIFDGNFAAGRMHLECWDAMGKSDYGDLQDGWMPGDQERGKSAGTYG